MRPTLKPYIQRNDSQYFKSWQPDSHYWTSELNPFVLFLSIWRVAAAQSWKTHQQQISRLINWTNPTLTCAAKYNETCDGSILNICIAFDATIFIHVVVVVAQKVSSCRKNRWAEIYGSYIYVSQKPLPQTYPHIFSVKDAALMFHAFQVNHTKPV